MRAWWIQRVDRESVTISLSKLLRNAPSIPVLIRPQSMFLGLQHHVPITAMEHLRYSCL